MARTLWGLIVVVVIALAWSAPSYAQAFHTAAEASAACQSHTAIYPADKQPVTCKPRQLSGNITDPLTGLAVHGCQYLEWLADGNTGNGFEYPCGSTQAQCLAMPSYPASYGSNISVCNAGCIYSPGPDANTDTVHGAGGYFAGTTSGQYSPTGQTCGVEVPQPPQDGGRLCGGGSCCDTSTGLCCAVNSTGGQVCVPRDPPGGKGGCVTGGDTTLCAGNPPPLPPNPPVADPATDIGASDTYGHQSGGGTINNTTINNYGSSGNAPNNGADTSAGDKAPPKSGDDPAGSSSTSAPKDPTSASGGGDCNTPPVCEGAAATCMVVKQTWLLRCPPGSQGQGSGDGGDGDTTVPGLDDVPETPGAGFMKSESLLDKLDQGGFGGGATCPKLLTIDIDMFDVHNDSTGLPWCDILGKVRWLLVMLAAYTSYRILSEK